MRIGPPIIFGINQTSTKQRQIEKEESLCNTIKMYCCILFTIGCIIFIIVSIVSIVGFNMFDSRPYKNNRLDILDDYIDNLSGSQ
jgi:Na+/H+-dicarboxylate symporter